MTARWSGSRRRRPRPRPDAGLRELLGRLQRRLGRRAGHRQRPAGRRHRRMLAPLRLTVAGLHGLELRRARAGRRRATCRPACWRLRGPRWRSSRPGTRNPGRGQAFERGLALPSAPAGRGGGDRSWRERLAAESEGALRLQRGKMVVELLPAGRDKGARSRICWHEPEFAGPRAGVRRRRRHRRGRISRRQRAGRRERPRRRRRARRRPGIAWPMSLPCGAWLSAALARAHG